MDRSGGGEYSFLRQLSVGSSPSSHYYHIHSRSKRWGSKKKKKKQKQQQQREEEEGGGKDRLGFSRGSTSASRKRVMVLVDQSTRAKHAMMWALTHIATKGDLLTLLHVVPPHHYHGQPPHDLAKSLGSLCKACRPEVEVESLAIQGYKLATVLSQVKKLGVSVLVLSQSKPSLLSCLFRSGDEEFVDKCIEEAECLTMAVRKRSKGVGGYLVSTQWQKNFWLLA